MANYSKTLAELTQSVAYSLDDVIVEVPTSTGSATTLICSKLGQDNDYFNQWYMRIYGGTNASQSKLITDFDAATDTLTFTPAVAIGTVVADTFQLHRRFRWEQYKEAVCRAVTMAQNEYLLNKSELIYVNRLTNGNFEDSTTGWTLTGAGATMAVSTTQVKEQAYSCKMTRAGADCYAGQAITKYGDFLGKTMTFQCWVWASVANRALIRVSDGIADHDSSYHTGGSDWELLTVSVDVDDACTSLTAKLCVLTGNTDAYFDQAVLQENQCNEAPVPAGFRYISEIWYEDTDGNGHFNNKIPSKNWWIVKDATAPMIHFVDDWGTQRLKIIGQSVQPALTTDTSVCYMNPEYVIQQARALLMQSTVEYRDLLPATQQAAFNERRMMSTLPIPGSKSVYEL